MQEFIRRKKMKDLIALRGMIHIDYDWEREEDLERKVNPLHQA
jgi:hypothetical protein